MTFRNSVVFATAGAMHAYGNSSCFDSCPAETGQWDGDFTKVDFCSCNFGDDCPFICGGGGDGNDGGFCSQNPCATGQYSFDDNGWDISVSKSQAKGKSPYRAFAYLPFWSKMSQMNDFDFSVSLKTTDICKAGAHVNVLFWTDGGPIFSILPPGAPGDHTGSCRLLAFADTYPNNWLGEMELADEHWYDVKIAFSGTKTVTVSVDGNSWTNDAFAGDLSSQNGPQLGVYSFDFGGTWTTDSFHLTIGSISGPDGSHDRHNCEFHCLDGKTPTTAATTTAPPSPSPSPGSCPGGSLSACIDDCPTTPAIFQVCVASCEEKCTTTTPAPAPAGMCCWQDCETMSTCLPSDACSNDEDSCRSCSGIWCPGSASVLV